MLSEDIYAPLQHLNGCFAGCAALEVILCRALLVPIKRDGSLCNLPAQALRKSKQGG